jgi:hypothetical protein
MDTTQTKSQTKSRQFETLHIGLRPDVYLSIREAARAEGLPASTWARRILVLVLAGSRRKKA